MALTADELHTPPPLAEETFITTADGTRLRTLCAGNGPTVVMAHGYGGTLSEWYVIARKLLAEGRRVILFDQRGHGGSTIGSDGINSTVMAADYQAVLEHYDVRSAVIIGHSMGGFLLIRFLLLFPQVARARLSQVVILASLAGKVNEGSLQNRLQLPLIRSGLLVALLGLGPVGRAFTRSLMGVGYTDAAAEAFIPLFRATHHRALVPILRALGDEDYYPSLHQISLPCTIMVGDRDKTTPAFHSRDLGRLIPEAKFVSLPGAGHLANWEAADTIASVLLERSAG